MDKEVEVIHNEKKRRFEIELGREYAFISYAWYAGNMAFMHTFVPESARGKGLAPIMAKFGLDYARSKGLQIMVYCPFVAKFIKRNPEYEALKNPKYHPRTHGKF